MLASVHSALVDAFAVIILGGTGGGIAALYLLGRFYPGSGSDQLNWRPARSPEQEIQNEIDDLDQMLAATNARRRARGKPELTEASIQAELNAGTGDATKRRDDYLADLEVVQMLEVKNQRRKRKGLPELTVEEYKASLEDPP
jgi:hypothetical protein